MTLQEHLASLGACDAARTWAGGLTSKEVWEKCERADWLLWWAARTDVNSLRQIVLAACACARRALRYIPEGENRPLLAIEAAECWAENPSAKNHDAARAAARAADAAATAADARAAEHIEMCVAIRRILQQPWSE